MILTDLRNAIWIFIKCEIGLKSRGIKMDGPEVSVETMVHFAPFELTGRPSVLKDRPFLAVRIHVLDSMFRERIKNPRRKIRSGYN